MTPVAAPGADRLAITFALGCASPPVAVQAPTATHDVADRCTAGAGVRVHADPSQVSISDVVELAVPTATQLAALTHETPSRKLLPAAGLDGTDQLVPSHVSINALVAEASN